VFFSLLFPRPKQTTSMQVAVLERFDMGQESAVILVHHPQFTHAFEIRGRRQRKLTIMLIEVRNLDGALTDEVQISPPSSADPN
jgi:hypothetical protein